MGVLASKFVDAWRGAQPCGADDSCATQTCLRQGRSRWFVACLILLWTPYASADTYRIATFAAPLSRDGPGLLLRDLRKGNDDQLASIIAVITTVAPDVLLLTDFDYDLDGMALSAFVQSLAAGGVTYDHTFAARPNTGLPTGLDMDGDGRTGEARDAQGYGRFNGDGGMAILSRFPIDENNVENLSDILWHDVAGGTLPVADGAPFPTQQAQDIQRLSTSGHWIVPITPTGAETFHLLAWSATPPVFDGPEDRNGLRNRDELLMWENRLANDPPASFIVLGNANLDPVDGNGLRDAMGAFLNRADLQDPAPRSEGGAFAADPDHIGDPSLDTADWPDYAPGNLRVSYVFPSMDWTVSDAGVFWPAPDDPDAKLLGDDGLAAGPHRLVWVDVRR
jgi:hypothetical protein